VHPAWVLLVVGGVLLLGATVLSRGRGSRFGRLVYQKNSLYHRIFVHEAGSVRTLRFAGRDPTILQSQVDLSRPLRHMHEYTLLALGALLYQPEPKRALVVGLGGGVIPRQLHHHFPELQIDIAEIDPDIQPIAEHFFGFRTDDRMRVHVADGRVFIRRQRRQDPVPRYDIVVLDAFVGDYIPFHLMTREFLQELRGVLAEDGVVAANVLVDNRLAHAELRTFQEVFEHCQAFTGTYSTNAIIVAFGEAVAPLRPREATRAAAALQQKHGFGFSMEWVADRLVPDPRPARRSLVLTDDQAPVNYLRWQEAEESIGEPPLQSEEPASEPRPATP
jgi:spermidine synthase